MQEEHAGVCGAYQLGPKFYNLIKTMGYYQPTMVRDCINYAKRHDACQFHANFIHQSLKPLHLTVTSCPFEAWGLDVMGPLTPKSFTAHVHILVAAD